MRPAHVALRALVPAALAFVLAGCPKTNSEPMSVGEAQDALTESNVASQASSLASSSVEISTNFTIGKAVQEAAAELRTFIQTQLPCAQITLADSTLTVKYGALPGACTYHGHTFTGSHSIHVSKNDNDQVLVDHTWTNLSNGVVTLNGTAHVTWDFSDKFRDVTYDTTWTRVSDARTGHGTGHVHQIPLAGGIAQGIQIDGDRSWTGASGKWDLSIQGVQAEWGDPVPQAGKYVLATPKNRTIELSFTRLDASTIECTLSSGGKSFRFDVRGTGADVTSKS